MPPRSRHPAAAGRAARRAAARGCWTHRRSSRHPAISYYAEVKLSMEPRSAFVRSQLQRALPRLICQKHRSVVLDRQRQRNSRWPMRLGCCPSDDFGEPDWSEIPHIHTNVELAWQRLQPAMAVAMQVDRSAVHLPPGSKRVVAKHQPAVIDSHFRVGLNDLPQRAADDRGIVVVADNEMLPAMQHPQQIADTLRRLANGEVAQVPYFVPGFDHRIPAIDHLLIHLGNRGKGATVEAAGSGMAKMLVAGEVDGHLLPLADLKRGPAADSLRIVSQFAMVRRGPATSDSLSRSSSMADSCSRRTSQRRRTCQSCATSMSPCSPRPASTMRAAPRSQRLPRPCAGSCRSGSRKPNAWLSTTRSSPTGSPAKSSSW